MTIPCAHDRVFDAICEERMVRIRFNKTIPWSTLLMPHQEESKGAILDTTVFVGTIMEVPFWLAQALISINVISILPLRQYGRRVRNDLIADAVAVNLSELDPFWYMFGKKVDSVMPEENISELLTETLKSRLGSIARAAMDNHSAANVDPHKIAFGCKSDLRDKLDHFEKILFANAQESKNDVQRWSDRIGDLIPSYAADL